MLRKVHRANQLDLFLNGKKNWDGKISFSSIITSSILGYNKKKKNTTYRGRALIVKTRPESGNPEQVGGKSIKYSQAI